MHRVHRSTRVLLRRDGFSLVEMIGVLAIIAILAVIIVPKVFSTIASSRITQAAASTNAIKSSVTEYLGKLGSIPVTDTATARLDDELVAKGLMESRFLVKIGTQPTNPPRAGATWNATTRAWTGGVDQSTQSRIVCLTSTATAPATAIGSNYRLIAGANTNLPAGSRVVSAIIENCTAAEARELSVRIDGDAMSQANATTADNVGRVAYNTPVNGETDVYIYLLHQ